jgi:hypothetical protein
MLILGFWKILWTSRKKNCSLAAPLKIQNLGKIQDGRQTIKCSRFVKKYPTIFFKKYSKWMEIKDGKPEHFSFSGYNFCIFQPT